MNIKHSCLIALFTSFTVLLSSCIGLIPALTLGVAGVGTGTAAVVLDSSQQQQTLISEIDIKSNKLVSINTIALLHLPEPPLYDQHTALGENTGEYEAFSFGKTSQDILKQQLEEYGFEVVVDNLGRNPEKITHLYNHYVPIYTNVADAYLEIVPAEIEYSLQGPRVSVVVRLVMVDTAEVIYAGSVQYGWDTKNWFSGIQIASPEDYSYESSEALIRDKEKAIERLVQGVEAVSSSIAQKIGMGKVNATIAAMEIDTKTYDKNLWNKALVETEGDQTKRKARYIELRANQLYSGKVGLASDTSLSQQATPINTSTRLNISGTYVSDITSNNKNFFEDTGGKLVFTLEQNENRITGVNSAYNLRIRGTRKGNIIQFYVEPHRVNHSQYQYGVWEINPDGFNITGSWKVKSAGAAGQWNLTMIAAASQSTAVLSIDRKSLLAEEVKSSKISSQTNPASEELVFEYYDQAGEEIDTQTYDKNLWDKALVETGGDQTKSRARYIELRANQLYSEKVGPVSDASLDQRAASVTPDTSIDISGTYRSDIIGSGDWSLGRFPNIEVILKQNKSEISGTFSGTRSGEIEGILNGDTIKFKWFLTVGRTESGRGEWKLTNDGITWNGTWRSTRGSRGNWNLTKIE